MPVPLIPVAGTVIGAIGDIFSSGSPRYAGGPLISTVNGFLNRVLQGDLLVIREMDNARKSSADSAAWQQVWTNELPRVPLTAEQYNLVKSIDPSLAVIMRAVNMPAMPGGPGAGPPVAGQVGSPQGVAPPPGTPIAGDNTIWIIGVVLLVVFFVKKGG